MTGSYIEVNPSVNLHTQEYMSAKLNTYQIKYRSKYLFGEN